MGTTQGVELGLTSPLKINSSTCWCSSSCFHRLIRYEGRLEMMESGIKSMACCTSLTRGSSCRLSWAKTSTNWWSNSQTSSKTWTQVWVSSNNINTNPRSVFWTDFRNVEYDKKQFSELAYLACSSLLSSNNNNDTFVVDKWICVCSIVVYGIPIKLQ